MARVRRAEMKRRSSHELSGLDESYRSCFDESLIENFMKAIRRNPNDLPERQSSPVTHAGPSPRTSPTTATLGLVVALNLIHSHVGYRIIDPQSHRRQYRG